MLPLLIGGFDTFINAMYEFQNDVAATLNLLPGVNIPIAQRPSDYTRQGVDTLRTLSDTPTTLEQQKRLLKLTQPVASPWFDAESDVDYSIRTPLKGDYGAQFGSYLDFGEFSHIVRDIPRIIIRRRSGRFRG